MADALASLDDAREMLSAGSAERVELDDIHKRLDALVLRSFGVPAHLLEAKDINAWHLKICTILCKPDSADRAA